MFKKSTKLQKAAFVICLLLIAAAVIFGVFTRMSFTDLTSDENAVDNAVVLMDKETAELYDERLLQCNSDYAKQELSSAEYVFKIKCISSEIKYNCTKHTAEVIKTIKGEKDEAGNKIVIYNWLSFSKGDGERLICDHVGNQMPLIPNHEYLVFVSERDYYEGYKKALGHNEYSISLGLVPFTYVIDDVQERYMKAEDDLIYSDIKDLYYICFSQKALDHINEISRNIVEEYGAAD